MKTIPKELEPFVREVREYQSPEMFEQTMLQIELKKYEEVGDIKTVSAIKSADLQAFWRTIRGDRELKCRIMSKLMVKPKIPTGMTLQKSLSKPGGQMHFKNGGGKKKAKVLSAKKTKRRVKKGSDNLGTFGIRLPNVKTLEDMLK